MAQGKSNPDNPLKGGGATGPSSVAYTHADFTYVRRKRKLGIEEESGELNIVPYLDILVNLIMFLLVTQATLVSIGLIDVSAPSYANVGAAGAQAPAEDEGKNLRLTVGIGATGFFIAAKGGVLPGQPQDGAAETTADGVEKREPTVPVKADGSYDYAALTRKLRGIKTAFPKAESVFIAADENTQYEVLVKTLDSTREDPTGPLFPAVAFTQIN